MIETDAEMKEILESLLRDDLDITARAVARLHPKIKAASSITRSENRTALLVEYQQRQSEYRKWRGRAGKKSTVEMAATLAAKDQYINELESRIHVLTASHVALLRAVGELGGFGKWAKFFEKHRKVRTDLTELGAIPDNVMSLHDSLPAKKDR